MVVRSKRKRSVRLALSIMASLSAWTAADVAMAQNVVRDYFVNEERHYSPDDYTERGWVYRVQAGYAGLFNRCDDDAMKRCSPYIYWKARPLPECRGRIYPNLSDAAIEIQQGVQRFTDGAGNCARPNNCEDGPPRFVPTLVNGLASDGCDACSPAGPALGMPVFQHAVPVQVPVDESVPVEQYPPVQESEPESRADSMLQSYSRRPHRPIAGAPVGRRVDLDLHEPGRLPAGHQAASASQALTARARNAGIHSVNHLSESAGQAEEVSRTASRDTSSRRR